MLDYEKLHWGTPPDHTTNLSCYSGPCEPIGELSACSYVTIKGDEPDIFRHEFKRFTDDTGRKRGPFLFKGSRKGKHRPDKPPKQSMAIGRAIDFELKDGRRVLVGGNTFLITNPEGSHVWLAGEEIPFAIETRDSGPIVTERGIEA